MIKKENGKYTVYSSTNRPFGTYDTKLEADKRLKQVELFKNIVTKLKKS